MIPRYFPLDSGAGVVDCGDFGDVASILSEDQARARIVELKDKAHSALLEGKSLVHTRLIGDAVHLTRALERIATLKKARAA